jgi:peptide chain release factor 2
MEHLKDLDTTLTGIEVVLDLDTMRRDIAELRDEAADPGLWNDQDHAQSVTRKLSYLESELGKVEALRSRLDDVAVLYELAREEDDADSVAEADQERESLARDIQGLEVRTLMSGEYDAREALVTINSQAGGVDAADFAQQLQRMYTRWADRHGYPTEVFETSYAEEAGIKSTTFAVKTPYAYGTLRGEHGTHRMVRISPYDNQGRRQTSFAGVDVVPVVEQSDHVEISDDDLRVDVYRSSGPGGQGVNTTDSAVRLTHLPTGIVVSCQNERSQLQNKATAMTVLQAKLLERKRQEERDEMNKLRGEGTSSWGTQIRSYVMQPYQMVKDLRTNHEEGNPQGVLDGAIDDFIEAEIRWLRKNEAEAEV